MGRVIRLHSGGTLTDSPTILVSPEPSTSPPPPLAALLVALHDPGRKVVHRRLPGGRHLSRTTSSLLNSLPIPRCLWRYCRGLCDWFPSFQRSHHPNEWRSLLEDRSLRAPVQAYISSRDGSAPGPSRLPTTLIPCDIMSDRGPQFTSQEWRSFCSALGVAMSLSSGYEEIRFKCYN